MRFDERFGLLDHPIRRVILADEVVGDDRPIGGFAMTGLALLIQSDALGIVPEEFGVVAMRDGLAVVSKEPIETLSIRIA